MNDKISIRFYGNRPVRAIWDEENSKWWFSVLDIIAIFNDQDDYTKTRNYWKYLKTKLKKTAPQLVSVTNQLKLKATDGKSYKTDVLDAQGVSELAKVMPNNKAIGFLDWFTYSENTIDGRSRKKAYDLFESGLLKKLEPGSIKCLQQIHAGLNQYWLIRRVLRLYLAKSAFFVELCRYTITNLQILLSRACIHGQSCKIYENEHV